MAGDIRRCRAQADLFRGRRACLERTEHPTGDSIKRWLRQDLDLPFRLQGKSSPVGLPARAGRTDHQGQIAAALDRNARRRADGTEHAGWCYLHPDRRGRTDQVDRGGPTAQLPDDQDRRERPRNQAAGAGLARPVRFWRAGTGRAAQGCRAGRDNPGPGPQGGKTAVRDGLGGGNEFGRQFRGSPPGSVVRLR